MVEVQWKVTGVKVNFDIVLPIRCYIKARALFGPFTRFYLSVLVPSSFITDTDRVSVIPFSMCTDSAQWTGIYHFSGL